MNKPYYIFIVLLLTFILGCSQQKANHAGNTTDSKTFVNSSQKDGTDWAKEAQKQYKNLAYYYNNNIHDTLVMKVPEVLDFCREHQLWADYQSGTGDSRRCYAARQQVRTDCCGIHQRTDVRRPGEP